jgi:hypothetical protein
MKFIVRLLLLIVFTSPIHAQSLNNYFFSSISGTFSYLPLTATSPALSSGSLNEGLYSSIPIGFDFFYLGRKITTVQTSTNGWMVLGSNQSNVAVAANNLNSFSLPNDLLAPLWDDLDLASGSFRYQTSGVAPNRIFTAEWRNVEWNWNSNTAVVSFQVKLFETSGIIQFEYAQEPGIVSGASATIGIRGLDFSSTNGFISLNSALTNPTSSTSNSTNTINTKPATGQIYRFSNNTANAPSNFNSNSRTINSMNLTWTDNSFNETGFVVYRSIDNVNFVYDGITASNTTSYSVSNLISGTTYFYKVYAINEGRLSNPILGSASTLLGTIGGIINIPGNYSSITAALNALRVSGMSSSVIIQLNTNYNNAFETYPINVSGLGTSLTRTLTIRPAANVTSLVLLAPTNNSVFAITSTSNFIIDGRPGGQGSNRALTLLCNNGVNTVSFADDCTNDTIRFCRIGLNDNGNGFFPFSSNITFYSSFGFVGGSNNNAIVNNEIYGINPPSSLITFSNFGSVVSQNNTISNNIMYDFAGLSRFFGGSNGAINIEGAFSGFIINNNSIYETQSVSSNSFQNPYILSGIRIASNINSSFVINNNIIGGSNTQATGNPWELGPVSEFNGIIPIDISVFGTSNLIVTNNTLRNYFIGSSATFSSFPGFCGIRFTSQFKATGVNISNNIIGRDTGNSSINIINEGSSTMLVAGILIDAPDTSNIICNANQIGSYNMSGPSSNNGFQFLGISMQSSGVISNNIIGSLTTNNSILASNTASSSQQTLVGISNYLFPGFVARNELINITGNTISGLRNNFNVPTAIDRMVGIDLLEARGSTISFNNIQQLTVSSSSLTTNFYPIKAIQISNQNFPSLTNTIINRNTISTLSNLSPTGAANVAGIVINSISPSTFDISRNFIHSFQVTTSSSNTQMGGIVLQEGDAQLTNNMIRLGINNIGLPITSPINISGVEINSSDNTTLWHNSIFIGGTLINSTSSTYAVKRNGNGSLTSINNILVNQRSFTNGNVKRNFALGLASPNLFISNHNCYFRIGNGSALAEVGNTIYDSLSLLRNVTNTDAVSGIVNPNFVNPNGNAQTIDLHVFGTTPIESNGTPIAAVTIDFDGQIRSSLSPADIGADAGLFTSSTLPVKWNSFDVKKLSENHANIQFTVASQLNNKYFSVERSLDGVNFTSVKQIDGALNTNLLMAYHYQDDISLLPNGYIYYRIVQVDIDGRFSKTDLRCIVKNSDFNLAHNIHVMPNPFSDRVSITYPAFEVDGEMLLCDVSGRILKGYKTEKNGNTIIINTNDLNNGVYFLKFNNQKAVKIIKTN